MYLYSVKGMIYEFTQKYTIKVSYNELNCIFIDDYCYMKRFNIDFGAVYGLEEHSG